MGEDNNKISDKISLVVRGSGVWKYEFRMAVNLTYETFYADMEALIEDSEELTAIYEKSKGSKKLPVRLVKEYIRVNDLSDLIELTFKIQ